MRIAQDSGAIEETPRAFSPTKPILRIQSKSPNNHSEQSSTNGARLRVYLL